MYIFVDESGELSNFTLSGSKYFVCTAVSAKNSNEYYKLIELRQQLAIEGFSLPTGFHAKNDPRPRRKRVFEAIASMNIEIDSVVLDKQKLYTPLREKPVNAFVLACRILLEYLFRKKIDKDKETLIVLSSYSSGNTKNSVEEQLKNLLCRYQQTYKYSLTFWEHASHPGLQLADYCSWVINKLMESGETDPDVKHAMSYIKQKITSKFEPFALAN